MARPVYTAGNRILLADIPTSFAWFFTSAIPCPVRLTPMKIDPTPGGGGPRSRIHEVCNIDISSGIFSAKGRTPKSKIAPLVSPTPFNINNVSYFLSLELVDRALERLEIFPANSSNANLLLKSATSAAKMYHLLQLSVSAAIHASHTAMPRLSINL